MQQSEQYRTVGFKDLDEVISKAIKKVGGRKENDLCKFLPVPTGGYMHHFTLRKMKGEQPEQLVHIIQKFIINTERPGKVSPKPRAARGSRKRRDIITLTRGDLDRMLDIARQVGDNEMIGKLSPKRSLAQLKRELIASIRAGQVNEELWAGYASAVSYNTLSTSSLAK